MDQQTRSTRIEPGTSKSYDMTTEIHGCRANASPVRINLTHRIKVVELDCLRTLVYSG